MGEEPCLRSSFGGILRLNNALMAGVRINEIPPHNHPKVIVECVRSLLYVEKGRDRSAPLNGRSSASFLVRLPIHNHPGVCSLCGM